MADTHEYMKRSQELYSDHTDFKDTSLVFVFSDFLLNVDAYHDRMFNGQVNEQGLVMLGLEPDARLSDDGKSILREAAAKELDEWNTDLRKSEPLGEEICATRSLQDPVRLGRLSHDYFWGQRLSMLDRYERVLASISPGDRELLEATYLNQLETGAAKFRVAVNDQHVRDQLYSEFPERVAEQAQKDCERYEQTRGKRYTVVNTTKRKAHRDASGKVHTVTASGGREYRLVDE